MDIPDELWADIRALAQARIDAAMAEIDSEVQRMAQHYATQFIDVSTISDSGKQLMHTATGRTLRITAKWDDIG
jgi:hypothetical protein